MTVLVSLAVLFAALLHAGWNAMIKASRDVLLDTAAVVAAAGVIAIPIICLAPAPAAAAWPWLLASVSIHLGYYALIVAAYRHGDLTLVYPLMRGAAPLLAALLAFLLLGERLSPLGFAGMALVCSGVLALGWRAHGHAPRRALAFALLNAGVIAAYTLVDGSGARHAGGAAQTWGYVGWLTVLDALPFTALVAARRGGELRRYLAARRHLPFVAAAASVGAYGIVIWAMTQAPVGLVAALRETSVLFAALLGSRLLKERLTPRRWLGAAAVAAGVVALKLG